MCRAELGNTELGWAGLGWAEHLTLQRAPVLSIRQYCMPTFFTAVARVVQLRGIIFLLHPQKGAERALGTAFVACA